MGIMVSSLALVYSDMLDEDDMQAFCEHPVLKVHLLGLPTTCIATTLFLLAVAGNLLLYGKLGVIFGILGSLLWMACFWKIRNIWQSISVWRSRSKETAE